MLLALNTFFGPAVKLDQRSSMAQADEPIVIEVTLMGKIAQPSAWHTTNCAPHGDLDADGGDVWHDDQRVRLIRRPDGTYGNAARPCRGRTVVARVARRVGGPGFEPGSESGTQEPAGDLIDALVAQTADSNSVMARMAVLVDEMEKLARRRDEGVDAMPNVGSTLTAGLASITPQPKQVRLQFAAGLPTLRSIFAQSILSIDDGVELPLEQHGMGMQRSLVVSILRTWCDYIRRATATISLPSRSRRSICIPHANACAAQPVGGNCRA